MPRKTIINHVTTMFVEHVMIQIHTVIYIAAHVSVCMS